MNSVGPTPRKSIKFFWFGPFTVMTSSPLIKLQRPLLPSSADNDMKILTVARFDDYGVLDIDNSSVLRKDCNQVQVLLVDSKELKDWKFQFETETEILFVFSPWEKYFSKEVSFVTNRDETSQIFRRDKNVLIQSSILFIGCRILLSKISIALWNFEKMVRPIIFERNNFKRCNFYPFKCFKLFY